MTKNARSILAIAVTVLFLMSSAVSMTCGTSAETSDVSTSVNDDIGTVVNLNDPLKFNATDGAASIKTINDAAGKTVCEYGNGILSFTSSVHIKLSKTLTDNSLLTFDADSDQGITVNDGCTVHIECPADLVDMKTTGNHAVILCDNWHGFTFRGQGQLNIDITGSKMAGTCPFDIMYAKGNLYFDNCKVTADNFNSDYNGNGFVYAGTDLKFTKGNVKCYSCGYAFCCLDTTGNHVDFEQCNITAKSMIKAFKFPNKVSSAASLVDVSGAVNYNDSTKEISSTEVENYQYVEFKSQELMGMDSNGAYILAAIVVVLLVAALLFKWRRVLRIRRRPRSHNRSGDEEAPINYEPVLMDDGKGRGGSTDTNNGSGPDNQTAPYAPYPADGSTSGETVEITVSSKVKSSLFAISIDGRVAGYICSYESKINVPTGMHDVRIFMNDASKMEIYRENVLFDGPMEFTVVMKINGFAVERK